jgi:isopenicillin N synthase-like dioxygenase
MATTKENNMADTVPVIDMSGFENDGDLARARIASTVSRALEGTGFFVIRGHGVRAQVVFQKWR